MQTKYKSNKQKQRNPHLAASASAARKYAINASSAFSCTGAFESATVFLKKCPAKFKKKKNNEQNHESRSKRKCSLANNNSAVNRIQIHHREIGKRIRKLKNPRRRGKKHRPNSRMRASLGSVMESQSDAKSMFASLRTFQFLWKRRSSHGNFFASFNNFSSSDIVASLLSNYNPHVSSLSISTEFYREKQECVWLFVCVLGGILAFGECRRDGMGGKCRRNGE